MGWENILLFVIGTRHTPPMAQGHRRMHWRLLITAIAIIARFVRFDTRRGLSPRLYEGQRVLMRFCRDGQTCDALAAAENLRTSRVRGTGTWNLAVT